MVPIDLDIIQKAGAWYNYGDENIGQRKENVKVLLKAHPEKAIEIEVKIRSEDFKKVLPVI